MYYPQEKLLHSSAAIACICFKKKPKKPMVSLQSIYEDYKNVSNPSPPSCIYGLTHHWLPEFQVHDYGMYIKVIYLI